MKLLTYKVGEEFLSKTLNYLEQDEAANNLMLGIAMNLDNYGATEPFLCTVESANNELLLAALQTPPYKLVVYGTRDNNIKELQLLIEQLQKTNTLLPGVIGPDKVAKSFTNNWQQATGCDTRAGMSMRVYELREVNHPRGIPGKLRLATANDTELITNWRIGFQQDAKLDIEDKETAWQKAASSIEAGRMYIWQDEHEQPVSMVAKTRPTRHGAVISSVYTPGEFRRNGYASACVAALSQLLLDSGYQFCSLFTDLSNPTSNSIYMKIGYQPLCDFNEYLFG